MRWDRTSMSDTEYEVESVTKARVDAKRGKKVVWKYHVKWKGYSWDECTWEPEKSFTAGSKHFIKTFWTNALTRGRDHNNALLFDRGEEVYASVGATQNDTSGHDQRESPPETSDNAVSDDEPLTTKKRRINQKPAGEPKAKRKRQSEPIISGNASVPQPRTFGPKSKVTPKSKKQRRASSPGVEIKYRPSPTNMTDTDAIGELDMDVFGEAREVEDELMLISPYSHETQDIPESSCGPVKVEGTTVVSHDLSPDLQNTIEMVTDDKTTPVDEGHSSPDPLFDSHVFQDLQRYSSDLQNTIEIEVVTGDETPPADESRSSPDPLFDSNSQLGDNERLSDLQNSIETEVVTGDETPSADEGRSSPDPLFDSDSQLGNNKRSLPMLPFHRVRVTRPLVRLIDTPQMDKNPVAAISAKARLISGQPSDSSQDAGSSNRVPEIRPRPGPGRFSAGLLGKNRSSLLTAGKGGLTSVKGRFKPRKNIREETESIEDTPAPPHIVEPGITITSWSNEDATGETGHERQEIAPSVEQMEATSTHGPIHLSVPSGHELLEIAGLKPDADTLPDFEDETPQPANASVVETLAKGPTEDVPPAIMTVEDKAAEKSLAEATEHLFPSVQAATSVLSATTSSWKTSKDNTIFGRMYKIQESVQGPSNGNESASTFKLILNADVSVPLVLKNFENMKEDSLTDTSADKAPDGQAGSFYLPEDSIRIASTFSGLGSARVVLDRSADRNQREHFDTFQQRLQSGQMFVAKAGKELLVFFSSQNVEIAQKLVPPQILIGLVNTVVLMRVQITDRNGYANAVMQISAK